MQSIKDIREKYPEYNDLTDQQLVDRLYQSAYSDMPREEFDRKIGFAQQAPRRATGELAEALTETAPGEFTGERGARYSHKPRHPQLVADLEDTNRLSPEGLPSVDDLRGNIFRNILGKEPPPSPAPLGALESATIGAGENVGAGAGGLAGAGIGATAGAALGGPLAPVTVPVGALIGGGLGALGGSFAQRRAESGLLSDEAQSALQARRRQAAEQNPLAYYVGGSLPSLVTGRPTLQVAPLLAGVGTGAVFEAGGQTLRGEGYDPKKIAAAGFLGGLSAKSNRLGQAVFGTAPNAMQRQLMDSEQDLAVSAAAVEAARRAGVAPTPAMVIPEGDLVQSVGATSINPSAATMLRTAGENISEQSSRMADEAARRVYADQPNVTAQALIDEAERIKGARLTDAERAEIEAIAAAEQAKGSRLTEAEQARAVAVAAAQQQRDAVRRQADELAEGLRQKYLTSQEEKRAVAEALPARVQKASEGVLPETRGGAPAAYTELQAQRDAARSNFKQLYDEAEAAGDVALPDDYAPAIADELATTAKSYAGTLEAGEAPNTERIVAKVAKALEERGGLTFADLNSLRRQLQPLTGRGDVDSTAARDVIRKVDEIEDQLVDSGWFGDSDVVQKWRAANQARREFGQNWENNVFERILAGQDPQAMTVTMFGTPSGPPVRGPNRESDITAVMGRLTPEAQEAVRQDTMDRLFSKDVGKPTFGKAFRKWERENPELAQVLVPQEARDAVVRARGDIAAAQRDLRQATVAERKAQREFTEGSRQTSRTKAEAEEAARAETTRAKTEALSTKSEAAAAATQETRRAKSATVAARASAEADFEAATAPVTLGQGFMRTDNQDFTRKLEGLTGPQISRTKIGARQAIRNAIKRPQDSRNLLANLAENDMAQANLRSLLGDDANDLIVQAKAATYVLDRAEDLRGLARGAQRRGPVAGEESGDIVPQGVALRQGPGGAEFTAFSSALNNVSRMLTARGVNRAEAIELADALLDPNRTEEVVKQLAEQVGMSTAQLAFRRARAFHSDTARRLGAQTGVQTVQALQPNTLPPLSEGRLPEEGVAPEAPPAEEVATFTALTAPTREAAVQMVTDTELPAERAAELAAPIIAHQLVEGTGDNPRSTAAGYGQFIDSTFIAVYKKTFPQEAQGLTDKQILAKRGTGVEPPMMLRHTQDNVDLLVKNRLRLTPQNIYAMHHMGEGGGVGLLRARPDQPAEQVLGSDTIAANPQFAGKTVGQVRAWLAEHAAKGVPLTQPGAA
ncbi:MAG: hypothetical protein INH43_03285 [Acidobacteriaceae bacterium]|nr:hypothetical protein [Acidobacteriaceae bacterium]